MLVIFVVFALGVATGEPAGTSIKRQSECDIVESNIAKILGPCSSSTRECLTTDATDVGGVDSIYKLLCPPTKGQVVLYDLIEGCRGKDYVDLSFSGVCGNTTLVNGTEIKCTDAILSVNDGSAAKNACCGEEANVDGSGSRCASELKRLSSDLGCCTGTIVFTIYLAAMEGCEGGLPGLFQAHQVDVPPLCKYTLYSGAASESLVTSIVTSIAAAVVVTVINIIAI